MEGLLSGSAALGARPRDRALARFAYGPGLTVAVGLLAALPVIVAAARGLHEGWQPVADRGIIATRSFDVFSSHTPLVGQYSFAGAVTGKLTYSFGPMLYWLLAVAAHVGAPQSFVWTMAIVNCACVLGAVALARRRGGVWLMAAAAVGIGLMCRSIAANNFYDIWNPSAGLFPLLALIFVCWSLACGDYRLLPVAALLVSFELQLEDSFVPSALGICAVGLAGLALRWLRGRGAGAAPHPRVWPWALAAAVVLAACWTPTVIDQVAHEGNFGHVLQAASERRSSLGSGVGLHAVERTVGVRPWWLVRPSDPFVRKRDVLHSQGLVAVVSTAVILAWLLVAGVLGARRRRWDIAAGAATALMLCVAVYAIASATPTKRMLAETLGYTLWSASTVGMFTWLIALWAAVELGRGRLAPVPARAGEVAPRPAPLLRPVGVRRCEQPALGPAAVLGVLAALALAGAAGGAGAAAGTPDEHAFEFPALGTINARLGAVPKGHSVYLNARLDGLITPLRPEITYELRRRGVRALGVGAYLRTGYWYERRRHRYDYVVWVYDNGRLPAPDAAQFASAEIRSGGHAHTVWLAISPAHPRAQAIPHAGAARASGAVAPAADPSSIFSAPRALAGCGASAPRVAFPSESPFHATGPGAIVWASAPGACAPGAGASIVVGALASDGTLNGSVSAPLPGGVPSQLDAVGAPYGRIAIAAARPRGGELLEARAGAQGPAPAVRGLGAPPFALARAYLGDVAVATLRPGPAIEVRVQRYFQHRFGPPRLLPLPPGRVSALTITMDFRSDVLLAWEQGGAIYAHMLRASTRTDPTQRLGASAPYPQLRALVSDNDHGMVAWSSTTRDPLGRPHTRVELALSRAAVRFPAPLGIASFSDPDHAGGAAGSLALVRLSSENVMLAWTQRDHGRYSVRAAPAVFAATRPSARLSQAGVDSVLADLVPGPAAEALAVWRTVSTSGPEPGRDELWAVRAFLLRGDRPVAGAPQRVAPVGLNFLPSAGIDPRTDRPLVAWLALGAHPRVEYASGPASSRYRPRGARPVVPAKGGTHWLRIALALLACLVLAGAALLAARRARRRAAPPARARR